MKKYITIPIYLIFATCLMFIFLTIYWNFYPYQTAKVNIQPLPILAKEIKPGETIKWQSNVDQYTTGVKVDVIKQIVCDTAIINIPATNYVTKKGHQEFINSSTILPSTTPLGSCKVVINSQFHINPIRVINLEVQTETFQVIK